MEYRGTLYCFECVSGHGSIATCMGEGDRTGLQLAAVTLRRKADTRDKSHRLIGINLLAAAAARLGIIC